MNVVFKRSRNFSQDEINTFVSILHKYNNILDSKKTTAECWLEKKAIWKKVEKEFNNQSKEVYRSASVLKDKYRNMKKSARKISKTAIMTGNGNTNDITINSIDVAVGDILGEQTDGIQQDMFDSDLGSSSQMESEDREYKFGQRLISTDNTTRMLAKDKWQELAEEKIKLIKARQEFEREKHLLEVTQLKEEHELKIKHMIEENEIKTKILKCQLINKKT